MELQLSKKQEQYFAKKYPNLPLNVAVNVEIERALNNDATVQNALERLDYRRDLKGALIIIGVLILFAIWATRS